MTWKEAEDALLQHFASRWKLAHPTVPVHYPNTEPLPIATGAAWLRFRIAQSFARRATIGGRTTLSNITFFGGLVTINTFTPPEKGDAIAAALDQAIEDLWRSAHDNGLDGGLHLDMPLRIDGIVDPSEKCWRSGVQMPFRFEFYPAA